MEGGEDFPFYFCVHGRTFVRFDDEQDRLVFKTSTWLEN